MAGDIGKNVRQRPGGITSVYVTDYALTRGVGGGDRGDIFGNRRSSRSGVRVHNREAHGRTCGLQALPVRPRPEVGRNGNVLVDAFGREGRARAEICAHDRDRSGPAEETKGNDRPSDSSKWARAARRRGRYMSRPNGAKVGGYPGRKGFVSGSASTHRSSKGGGGITY